ncbi:putative protein OBERON [Helianthus anomalus]
MQHGIFAILEYDVNDVRFLPTLIGDFIMGLESSLSTENRLPTNEPIEEFLFKRCKNVNCKQLLTVEDCDYKICSTKKRLCSKCMCLVCLNFDFASKTYSWIGCDVCSL